MGGWDERWRWGLGDGLRGWWVGSKCDGLVDGDGWRGLDGWLAGYHRFAQVEVKYELSQVYGGWESVVDGVAVVSDAGLGDLLE